MYCKNCGSVVDDGATFCSNCGAAVERDGNAAKSSCANGGEKGKLTGAQTVAVVFMILSIVAVVCSGAVYLLMGLDAEEPIAVVLGILSLIPVAWMIPMTVNVSKSCKRGKPLSVGFKVVTLIFVNVISGIILLATNEQ